MSKWDVDAVQRAPCKLNASSGGDTSVRIPSATPAVGAALQCLQHGSVAAGVHVAHTLPRRVDDQQHLCVSRCTKCLLQTVKRMTV